MYVPSAPARFRLSSRLLQGFAWPLAAVEAMALALLLDNLWLAPLALLLLHDRHLPASVRTRSLRPFAAPSTLLLFAVTTAASLDLGRVAVALGVPMVVHLGALVLLRSLRQRGHFLPRVALVGPPEETEWLARRLRRAPGAGCEVVGHFAATSAGLDCLLAHDRRHSLDGLLLAGPPGSTWRDTATLARLKQLSTPIVLAESLDDPLIDGQVDNRDALPVDNLDTMDLLAIAERFGQERYGYAVTPNAHHLVRLEYDLALAAAYRTADYVVLDSRFVAHWLRWTTGVQWNVCPGSDLTAALFAQVIRTEDPVVIVGGTRHQAHRLRLRHGLRHLAQHIPPMGFIGDPAAREECLRFIERHSPFRFCLLAVGSPQQEILAAGLRERGQAHGLALCVGASLNFLTGDEHRAPPWMRRWGLEWFHRLLQDPQRLTRRYLLECPRVFGVLRRHPLRLRVRTSDAPSGLDRFNGTTVPAADHRPPCGSAPPANRCRRG